VLQWNLIVLKDCVEREFDCVEREFDCVEREPDCVEREPDCVERELVILQTSSVAVDDTTVYGPRSMTCFSPTPPDFEEQAKNEGKEFFFYNF